MLTLVERLVAYQRAYAQWPASSPWLVQEQGRQVLYGVWVIGNDYQNKTRYYGAYPAGFLERVMALFPDATAEGTLHVFAGSLPPGPYRRLDINPFLDPDYVGSVYDAATLVGDVQFPLILADPPYSEHDAQRYNTLMIDRRKVLAALAGIAPPGGYLAWLDTVWPMHSKTQWVTVGRILVQRSTNHRARVLSLFERVAA